MAPGLAKSCHRYSGKVRTSEISFFIIFLRCCDSWTGLMVFQSSISIHFKVTFSPCVNPDIAYVTLICRTMVLTSKDYKPSNYIIHGGLITCPSPCHTLDMFACFCSSLSYYYDSCAYCSFMMVGWEVRALCLLKCES